jgi:hypothetical protein
MTPMSTENGDPRTRVIIGAPRLQIKRVVFDSHLCPSVTSVDKEIARG